MTVTVTWESSRTVVVIKLLRTSALPLLFGKNPRSHHKGPTVAYMMGPGRDPS